MRRRSVHVASRCHLRVPLDDAANISQIWLLGTGNAHGTNR
jgi:hypothetical protein